MKTRVIFASLILGLSITTTTNAATTIHDDSPLATRPAGTVLVNGSEKQFSLYADQKMSRLTRQPAWQSYMNIVSMYNENPVAVLSLSAAERDNFNKVSSIVAKQLAKQKDADASLWLTQVDNTVRMLNYFWILDQEEAQLADTE